MRASWIKSIFGAASLAVALPAPAQDGAPAKVLRLEIGGIHIGNSGCSEPTSCDWSAIPGVGRPGLGAVVLGASHDEPLGRVSNLTVGGRLMGWSEYDTRIYLEPVLGVTWKFALPGALEARVHTGIGVWIGDVMGAMLRFGLGLGVPLSAGMALGLDLYFEGGVLDGSFEMTSSATIGPAFRL